MTDFEALGGTEGVSLIMARFVDRVFADPIIGFFFVGRDRDRILRHEIEHATRHLGGPSAYSGRPIGEVHRPLQIHQGHFRRRIAILRHVLAECGVDAEIAARWVGADERLQAVVTGSGDCLS